MAAPQIPNLNTLRRDQSRPSGRGRGAPLSLENEEEKAVKDAIVQQTDQDASISRSAPWRSGTWTTHSQSFSSQDPASGASPSSIEVLLPCSPKSLSSQS